MASITVNCKTSMSSLNGKTYPHRYFEDPAIWLFGLSTDGLPHSRNEKALCGHLSFFNYNLPPDICFHLNNILALGVIPGPKKPHDVDSFLWPLLKELYKLAIGVRALIASVAGSFSSVHFYTCVWRHPRCIDAHADEGHNGISPCRMCKVIGLRVSCLSRHHTLCPT